MSCFIKVGLVILWFILIFESRNLFYIIIILKNFLFCKWGFFKSIIINVMIGFDFELRVCLNENVIFSVYMCNYNVCCFGIYFVNGLKINCINVFFVYY